MTTNQTFSEQLKTALQQSFVWSKQHPTDHLSNYALINIAIKGDIVMQVLSLQQQYNYGYTIHSFIAPNHIVWLSPVGMMFGQGNSYNETGEQQVTCPADPQYAASIIENILLQVYGSLGNATVTCEIP